MPLSEIAWDDSNVVYGGKSKGFSVETIKKKPAVEDYSAQMETIKSNSGVRW